MPEFETTITIGNKEFEVEVEYYVEPAQRGSCDSMGVPEEPSWDAYVESIDSVKCNGTEILEFQSPTVIEDLMEEAKEHFKYLQEEY